MTFSEIIDDIKRQQQEASAVAHEQSRLAPTRAALVAGQKAFVKRKPTLAEIFGAAQAKAHEAASVGIVHSSLNQILQEACGRDQFPGLLVSLEQDYRHTIARIDGLSEQDLNMVNVMKAMPNEPQRLKDCLTYLEKLAKQAQRITADGGELERLVLNAARQAPILTATPEPRPASGPHVDSEFPV